MECFSLGILEALAANVAVITTPVGGNLEVIKEGKNGFVFPAKDAKTLSQILLDIITFKRSISTNVSIVVKNTFSINNMVQNHYESLQKCISLS
jgi:glycosyltransferase involved in cell wall biosynthesis